MFAHPRYKTLLAIFFRSSIINSVNKTHPFGMDAAGAAAHCSSQSTNTSRKFIIENYAVAFYRGIHAIRLLLPRYNVFIWAHDDEFANSFYHSRLLYILANIHSKFAVAFIYGRILQPHPKPNVVPGKLAQLQMSAVACVRFFLVYREIYSLFYAIFRWWLNWFKYILTCCGLFLYLVRFLKWFHIANFVKWRNRQILFFQEERI